MRLVIDSSVLVSAGKVDEALHKRSAELFERIRERGDEVWAPMTLLWEIGAALDHPGKTPPATTFNRLLDVDLRFVPIDMDLFGRTWRAGLRIPIKGGDRLFLSCALDKEAVLISWDAALVKHASAVGVRAATPEDYLTGGVRPS
ncbi:MAG: PIN domain-containing protein [Acidobacteria bacterium]|nr:PIN domain-containing protein [Acidobacteriota bacterium]